VTIVDLRPYRSTISIRSRRCDAVKPDTLDVGHVIVPQDDPHYARQRHRAACRGGIGRANENGLLHLRGGDGHRLSLCKERGVADRSRLGLAHPSQEGAGFLEVSSFCAAAYCVDRAAGAA